MQKKDNEKDNDKDHRWNTLKEQPERLVTFETYFSLGDEEICCDQHKDNDKPKDKKPWKIDSGDMQWLMS